MKGSGAYPPDWPTIARAVKTAADWRCARCGHPHDRPSGHVLTVHHLDGDKSNSAWWNLVPLCQRCHLSVQARVVLHRPWVLPHSAWFRPYAAGWYAHRYLRRDLPRDVVERHLEELLSLEPRAVLGVSADMLQGEIA